MLEAINKKKNDMVNKEHNDKIAMEKLHNELEIEREKNKY